MKRCWTSIALAISITAFAAADQVPYVADEVLVKVRPGSANMVQLYHNSIGSTVVKEFPEIGWQKVKLKKGYPVPNAVSYYGRLAGVASASPNRYRYPTASVNDPLYGQQYSPGRMKIDFGWDLTLGDQNVVVAVLDTGVDYNHPDLLAKVIKGGDHVTGDNDPMDEEGHGTHVAGIIGAHTNNGIGVAGIGYNVMIRAIRVLGPFGGSEDMIVGGIMEAANANVDIINMSLGGYFFSQMEQDAITYAVNRNVVVMAAAGNDNIETIMYPAGMEGVVSVGSTDRNDVKSGFSNFGSWVDVAAPGSDIMSTLPNNQYGNNSGTSMACPNAAGVAALVISYAGKGLISNAEVEQILRDNTVFVGPWLATGRLDGDAAIRAALPPLIEVQGPTTVSMFDGSTANGTAESLWTSDNAFYSVFSRLVKNLGGVAGAEMTFSYNHPVNQFQSGRVGVRSYGVFNSTTTTYIKKNDGTYEKLKSWPTSGSQISVNVPLPRNMTNYVKNKTITLVVRNVLPSRFSTNTFGYHMNAVRMETRTSQR